MRRTDESRDPDSVAFSKKVDPDNAAILKLEQFCKVRLVALTSPFWATSDVLAQENDVTTGKSTIGDEKEWNVFMRTSSPAVQSASLVALPSELLLCLC